MAQAPRKPQRKPARPKNLPQGRWLGDFKDLSGAELRLVTCCAKGAPWMPPGWDWQNPVRPEAASDANRIRAELIRFLALGGDTQHPVHEEGVMVWGAWITGRLTLHQCRAPVRLSLGHCWIQDAPNFMAARLPELALIGSHVPGMNAERLKVTGSLFLRDGFTAEGEVRLLGAAIGGDLDCNGGSFTNQGGNALHADRIKVMRGVFLRNGFTAEGAVRLLGAEISGNLDCSGGRIANKGGNALIADNIKVRGSLFLYDRFQAKGAVRLLGAEIGSDLACSGGSFANQGGNALDADRIKVTGSLFLREASIDGAVSLGAAHVATLIDAAACWTSGGHISDSFHYDRIIGPTDAASRIAWLKSQHSDQLRKDGWAPQPWEQLIKVLREMGHPGAAAEVAIEKQRMMRKARQIGGRQPRPHLIERWKWLELGWIALVNLMMRLRHRLYEVLAGFGYRPGRILIWMIAVWGFGGLYFSNAANSGLMAPSNAEVIMHRQLHKDISGVGMHAGACGLRHEVEPSSYWPACVALPSEYTTFNPWLYSADLILPLVDLQQDSEWAPAASFVDARGNVHDLADGQRGRALLWFEIMFGWFASLMFVAIVSRLVEKD